MVYKLKALNPYSLRNSDFTKKVDVVCPRCEKKALVIGSDLYIPTEEQEEKMRFSCTACGHAIKYTETPKMLVYVNSRGKPKYSRVLYRNSPIDPFFGFNLWYRIEANEGMLWAYNLEHLEVIEAYIADTVRDRNGLSNQNNSIASRLPKWVSAAKNREYLLRLIGRVKAK